MIVDLGEVIDVSDGKSRKQGRSVLEKRRAKQEKRAARADADRRRQHASG